MSEIRFVDLGALHREIAPEVATAWDDVLASSAFIGGKHVDRFEQAWAAYIGVGHAIGVGNGTDALSLILRGLGIGAGDEVIVPANTFIATPAAVLDVGAVPVFVDVDPNTLLVTAAHIEAAVTTRTAAVMVVHLFGQPADMDAIGAVAARHGIAVVEDAAQAHGATWRGRPAGSLGTAAGFSFYPGKNLGAYGDGGAVVTDDAELAWRIRSWASHGRAELTRYEYERPGVNSRLDNLQAAVLEAKLAHLARWNDRRCAIAARYAEHFEATPVRLVDQHPDARSVHHLFVIQVADRDRLAKGLAEQGIATGIHYPVPCHAHPPYQPYARSPLPVTETAARDMLSLPMHPHLSDGDVDRVAATVLGLVGTDTSARE